MPFDPLTWAVGYSASKSASSLLERVFDVGALGEIKAAAAKWSSELPNEIQTPAEALFDIDSSETREGFPNRNKLKQAILELHNVPNEDEWFHALIESWEFKREQLGADANAFFQIDRLVVEEHLRQLAQAIFTACASVLKLSQPLLIKEIREIARTQELTLQQIKSLRLPLNNPTAERNEAIRLNFDPTHMEETQLHLLNEIVCVDSPAEEIAGRYRTHDIWIGPAGCSRDNALYIPIGAQYIDRGVSSLLNRWNQIAADLAKQGTDTVISAIASFHHKFLEIHPYPDGNGRIARAILDLQVRNLTSSRLPLRLKSKDEYYLALRAADDGDLEYLIRLITSILKRDIGDWE